MTETLEARQEELQQKSKAVRAKPQSRNARNQRKQKEPRLRASLETIIRLLLQAPEINSTDKVKLVQILGVLQGRLPVSILEVVKIVRQEPQTPAPVSSGSVLEPAKSY